VVLENLKKLRAEAGISQSALADSISLSQQSINQYENHSVEPDIGTLIRIADYFNTSVDYLVGNTDIRYKIASEDAEKLLADEKSLLAGYRRLTPRQRKAIMAVIESYL
jgi:transcriptional regulator with XRE-family HTH domain